MSAILKQIDSVREQVSTCKTDSTEEVLDCVQELAEAVATFAVEVFNEKPAANNHIYAVLAKAQAEFLEIKKTTKGQIGNLNFMYAPLDEVYHATLPALNKYGIFHNHTIREINDGATEVACNLHFNGQTITPCVLTANHDGTAGNKGKAITYMARYTFQRAVGVIGEEDTDAQGLEGSPRNQSGGENQQRSGNNRQRRPSNQQQPAQQEKTPEQKKAELPPEKRPYTLNAWKKRIDQTESADDLYKLVDVVVGNDPLVAKVSEFNEVCKYLCDSNDTRFNAPESTWAQEDYDRIRNHLFTQMDMIDMERQASGAAAEPDRFTTLTGILEKIDKVPDMMKFLASCEEGEHLNADLPTFKRVLEAAAKHAEALGQSGKWKEQAVDGVHNRIKEIKKAIDPPATQQELPQ